MANNKITVHFEAKNNKQLENAIKNLSKAQNSLNKTVVQSKPKMKELDITLNKIALGMQKTALQSKKVSTGLFDISNKGRLVENSFATIRSQLLLVSFGFGLVSGSVLRLVNLFAEQELAEKRLSVALGFHSDALVNQASALQAQTRFGDEAIINAQALLAAFIKDEEQLKKATEATLDIASAKGMDLTSAADLVAKSIGSSTNSLTRYGIEAEGAAGSQERLESITNNIAKIFGGFAKGELSTVRGMLDATSNAIGDAGENFGKVLLPVVMPVAEGLKAVSEAFDPARVKNYALAIGTITTSLTITRAVAMATAVEFAKLKALFIKSGIGIATVAIGELAHRMGAFRDEQEFANREIGTFDAFLLGIGATTLDTTDAVKEYNEEVANTTESLGRSKDEIDSNVKSLEKKLALLELNADEMDRSDQLTKALIESGGSLTLKEAQLIEKINDITIARKEEARALKEIQDAQKEFMDFKKQEAAFSLQILGVQSSLNTENNRDLSISKARIGALSQISNISENLAVIISDRMEAEGFLEDIEKRGNIRFQTTNQQHQTRINLILELLALQEQVINKNYEEAESERAKNKEKQKEAALQDAINRSINNGIKLTGALGQMSRKHAKAMANIQYGLALIDAVRSGLAVRKNLNDSGVPFILSAIAGGLETAAMIAIATQIRAQSFEQGGLVGGRRHSQGGTLIEAERGEFVMSRNAVQSIGVDNLEAMNQGGSAVNITITGNVMTSDFVEGELAEKIRDAVRTGTDFGMS